MQPRYALLAASLLLATALAVPVIEAAEARHMAVKHYEVVVDGVAIGRIPTLSCDMQVPVDTTTFAATGVPYATCVFPVLIGQAGPALRGWAENVTAGTAPSFERIGFRAMNALNHVVAGGSLSLVDFSPEPGNSVRITKATISLGQLKEPSRIILTVVGQPDFTVPQVTSTQPIPAAIPAPSNVFTVAITGLSVTRNVTAVQVTFNFPADAAPRASYSFVTAGAPTVWSTWFSDNSVKTIQVRATSPTGRVLFTVSTPVRVTDLSIDQSQIHYGTFNLIAHGPASIPLGPPT